MDTSGESGITTGSDAHFDAGCASGVVLSAPLCDMVRVYVSIRANPALTPAVFTTDDTAEYSIISSSIIIELVEPAAGAGNMLPDGKSRSISVAPVISELSTWYLAISVIVVSVADILAERYANLKL